MHETVTLSPSQPNLVVGWASGLLQVWPAEDHTIGFPAPTTLAPRQVDQADHGFDAHLLAS